MPEKSPQADRLIRQSPGKDSVQLREGGNLSIAESLTRMAQICETRGLALRLEEEAIMALMIQNGALDLADSSFDTRNTPET